MALFFTTIKRWLSYINSNVNCLYILEFIVDPYSLNTQYILEKLIQNQQNKIQEKKGNTHEKNPSSVLFLANQITEIRQLPLQAFPVILLTCFSVLVTQNPISGLCIWNETFIASYDFSREVISICLCRLVSFIYQFYFAIQEKKNI